MRRRPFSHALSALAVVAAACAGGGSSVTPTALDLTSPSPTETSGAAAPDGGQTGPTPAGSADPVFVFEAQQVTGGTYDAGQLSGRDVAIWFWAPW